MFQVGDKLRILTTRPYGAGVFPGNIVIVTAIVVSFPGELRVELENAATAWFLNASGVGTHFELIKEEVKMTVPELKIGDKIRILQARAQGTLAKKGDILTITDIIDIYSIVTSQGKYNWKFSVSKYGEYFELASSPLKRKKYIPIPTVAVKKSPLTQSEIREMKSKLKGYTKGTPHHKYGQWIGVEIECMLKNDLIPNRFKESSDRECDEHHDCTCDLESTINDWIDGHYRASEILNFTAAERMRVNDEARDEIYCEENHCDCNLNHDEISDYFEEKGYRSISSEDDGSIRPTSDYTAIEFQVNFEISNPSPLQFLLECLNTWGAKVNDSCGLHVHFDRREKEIISLPAKVVELGLDNESAIQYFRTLIPLFQSLVPDTRKFDNQYCKPIVRASKYSYVNLSHKNTIEFRFFNGSVNYEKILSFCNFLNETMKMIRDGWSLTKYTKPTLEWVLSRQEDHGNDTEKLQTKKALGLVISVVDDMPSVEIPPQVAYKNLELNVMQNEFPFCSL